MCVLPIAEHQPAVTGVTWQEGMQAWRALWCEKGDPKRKSKYFYVKDHGFDRAKVRMTPAISAFSLSL